MRICVLQSSYEGSNSPFSGVDPYSDPASYFKNVKHDHHFEKVLVKKATAAQQIRDLARDGRFDVFINLCDGAFDEDRAGFEVVQLLERYGLAFTGANSKFYEPSKELMKMMAYYYDVNTAPFVFAYNEEDIKEAHQNLRYPMIVKHYNGYSSVGMTKDSRVNNEEELLCQARKMIEDYGGALIEEFIEGREFTVLVAENPDNELEPLVYTPVECKFSNGETFKHFDLKWKEYSGIKWVSCTDEALSQKLKEMSQRIFLALGGVGYGRTDIRVNEAGEPFFLEINPNCGIFYAAPEDDPEALGSADFILINDPTIDHVTFTEHIIQCALKRQAHNKQQVAVRFKHGMGYGLFALRDFAEGELVVQYEETPHYIVSKGHVERTWNDPLKKSWFASYAYPLTDNLWGIWSDNPSEWRQINHSCDPNAWLVGLNVHARRPIAKGEPITMDYATFCVHNMNSFNCKCASSECRGFITGTDHLQPFVGERYSGHLSDFVENSRRKENCSSNTTSASLQQQSSRPEQHRL